jgi:hypothetical protein
LNMRFDMRICPKPKTGTGSVNSEHALSVCSLFTGSYVV